ncbi:hypothetical protein PVK06_009332 [Gossypium arboreum]|uniref:Uncharacterized protein n=1 Tax=Gossypium arboreum TaxID=29729 RepID=A0ABR0QM63_GOSAR|nr:hypothetical protein PVK06_009332 [Gossypium arboreum]
MASSLIRFDDNHIFAAQVIMADDCVLEGFIHNLSKSPDIEIRGYLQDARFLHVSRMLRGCNLDPTLISTLVERCRLEKHTFHLHTMSVQSHLRTFLCVAVTVSTFPREDRQELVRLPEGVYRHLDCRMEFLPIYEPFFSSDTPTCLEYMPWFKVVD